MNRVFYHLHKTSRGPLQVELDHARLAMLAVLLSGVVGAGAGVPANASFMDDANISLSAVSPVSSGSCPLILNTVRFALKSV